MNNIWIGIKRFIKNKNTITILAIVASLLIIYYAYNWRINKSTEMVSVPYATQTISPRTKITSDMIGTVKIPRVTLNALEIYTNTSDLTDEKEPLYVNYDVEIPKNSFFYKNTLVTWDDLPTNLYADIEDNYTVFTIDVDSDSTFGNSIFPGNYIDLYYEGVVSETGDKTTFSLFIENFKVLSVVDSNGDSVFEKSSELSSPAKLMFAVPDDMYELLSLAPEGSLIPVPKNNSEITTDTSTKIVNSVIQKYILSRKNNTYSSSKKGGN